MNCVPETQSNGSIPLTEKTGIVRLESADLADICRLSSFGRY
jgi:hypothetical protein